MRRKEKKKALVELTTMLELSAALAWLIVIAAVLLARHQTSGIIPLKISKGDWYIRGLVLSTSLGLQWETTQM